MTLSPMMSATVQAGGLGAISNILAQLITAYRTDSEIAIDWFPVIQFLLFNVISTPPNFLWQDLLESTFPSNPKLPASKNTKKTNDEPAPLSIRNTAIKFLLDQTLGAVLNTLLFCCYTGALRQAVSPTPHHTNLFKAVHFWTSPGAIDLDKVDWASVWAGAKADCLPFVVAGWKFWPAVSLFNFTAVQSIEGRSLVGAVAGLFWGIYVSLVVAQ